MFSTVWLDLNFLEDLYHLISVLKKPYRKLERNDKESRS